jgi:hypothetical protein
MTKRTSRLIEGFVKGDLVRQIIPNISVDEYSAKVGEDADIVTLTFSTRTKIVGEDLAEWFDRGYDWVMAAEVSEGELKKNHYLVFVEVERRSKVSERIVELVADLETLTELPVDLWSVTIDGHDYPLEADTLEKLIPHSPHQYRLEHPEEESEEEPAEEESEEPAQDDLPGEGELPPPPPPADPNALPPAAPAPAPVPGQVPQAPAAPAAPAPAPVPGQVPQAPAAPAAPAMPPAPMFENALAAYRNLAGLPEKSTVKNVDSTLRDFLNRAGL